MSIVTELIEIYEKNGDVLRPEDVVEFARNPKTALHKEFTWDDSEAARQYRLHQARRVITVHIQMEDDPPPTVVRALVETSNPATGATEYVRRERMLTDTDRRARLIRQGLSVAKNWRTRHEGIEEFAPIFAAIDEVEQKVASLPAPEAALAAAP